MASPAVTSKRLEQSSQAGGLIALVLYLASAILLIVSSALTVASRDTSLGITGATSGAFIIAGGVVTFFAEYLLMSALRRRRVPETTKAAQGNMIWSAVPITAGGIVYTIGYALKIGPAGAPGPSIIATIGAAVLLYGLVNRLLVIQVSRRRRTFPGFLRVVAIDFIVAGGIMFLLTNIIYIIGPRWSLTLGGIFGIVAGGLFSTGFIIMMISLVMDFVKLSTQPPEPLLRDQE